ncbi:hypothetical protein LEP1GSC050_0233 [Leptospira broomii serovar Hurstbridge str. 5399]|uniref:Uncharacterized protein n=2 Tax=Leptospira broomii TaxID=301541 RepID=T0F593_9LEPT|nr:hypothetical protein LEP1GSC050_0233 [Leptospira broomii serovar Hurstbridge str. 5399]
MLEQVALTVSIFSRWKYFAFFGNLFLISLFSFQCSFRPSPINRTDSMDYPEGITSLPEDGEYFSQIQSIPTGFYIRQIYLNTKRERPEFLLSQLSVTESKNWEETRFEGKIVADPKGRGYRFRPKLCRMFTSKGSGDRWTLTRAYECDHFEFLIWKSGQNQIRLIPGPEGEEEGIHLRRSSSSAPNRVAAVVLFAKRGILEIWGMRLSKVRKDATLVLEKSDGKRRRLRSLITVETTGEIQAEGLSISTGDLILYTNPGEAAPLAYE